MNHDVSPRPTATGSDRDESRRGDRFDRRTRLRDQVDDMGKSVSTLAASPSVAHASRTASRRRAETQDSEKAGRIWAREVDDAWWPCILTLDGGGIRGYSSLMILKALMHEVWFWEERLDREEAELNGEGRSNVDSPMDMTDGEVGQADAGAVDDVVCDRQEVNFRDEKHAAEVEQMHGVSEPAPSAEQANTVGARHTAQQDRLAAEVSTRKAMSEEELLPCHYFDFMYGTSTGGLIATILGRLRMTVSEGLELYRKVGEDLFGKRRSQVPLRTKYYHEPLEKAVQDIVGARCHEHKDCDGRDDLHPWDAERFDAILQQPVPFDVDRPRLCQSCCLTATHDENIVEAYLLRSYPHYYKDTAPNWITRYNEGADELPIWKVTRATSAAPFYFEMISHSIDGVTKSFKDGGIRENNPSGAALSEFHALYEGKAEQPALLLSIGTGRPDTTQDGFASNWPGPFGRIPLVAKFLEKRAVIQNLLIKYTEGEKQHHQMREHAHGEHTWYKRLNVSSGLQNMPLDDWRRGQYEGRENVAGGASLGLMESVTEEYLERGFDPEVDSYAPPKVMLRQAAEKLVRQRRAREALGGVRWDTFVGKSLRRPAAAAAAKGINDAQAG
ncbi:hypothetical protein LTR62_002746 [Meristemomyces frigidus]|uniref:PNPLA domain-containing protein n=1 Tax=Meristemomyces frigidus TaxID=1508187 RepID=A0AAN7YHC5_9PEZI|nr:hypothetical protein LTR62_002746 [Meristemomyces frigidus]